MFLTIHHFYNKTFLQFMSSSKICINCEFLCVCVCGWGGVEQSWIQWGALDSNSLRFIVQKSVLF